MGLSDNTLERISRIYGFLEYLDKKNVQYISSKELAKNIGTSDYSIRKDMSSLDVSGFGRSGYEVKLLKEQLGSKLHLKETYNACIVGLGKLGTALLDYEKFKDDGFEIVAGFDNSVNKIERLRTKVDVFMINQLEEIVRQRDIHVGIIAVPPRVAGEIAEKLVKGGVKGILNFSPTKIIVPENVILHDMDFTAALRYVAARFN